MTIFLRNIEKNFKFYKKIVKIRGNGKLKTILLPVAKQLCSTVLANHTGRFLTTETRKRTEDQHFDKN